MGRPGVTYTEVYEAAAHIIGKGKSPTIEQVRLFLGTGSSTTIANYLKQWKDAQQSTHLLAVKEKIPQELIEMVKGLWDRIIKTSDEKIASLERNFEQTIADLQKDLNKYKENNGRWQQLFNQWQQEKSQLESDKIALEEGNKVY